MYILNTARTIKNEFKDFERYYKRIGFSEENSYYSMKHFKKKLFLANKLIEKITDSRNAKEHCQSFIRKKPHKISITIRNNYLSPKIF